MREFLEKLQEDQRRMRKFLRSHALHFKRMGELLAGVRKRGSRIFVVGEPPLDRLALVIAEDYLAQLPALHIDLNLPQPPSVDPDDDDPPGTAREAAAKQAGRHFHKGDCLLAFLVGGEDREMRILMEAARAKRARVLIIGGLGVRSASNKRLSKVLLALPTRGAKTICESSFVCARILARVSRGALGKKSDSEDGQLVQVTCETCNERVFFEDKDRGRKVACPLCEGRMRVPKDSGRRVVMTALPTAPRRRKLKPSVLELPILKAEELELIGEIELQEDSSLEVPDLPLLPEEDRGHLPSHVGREGSSLGPSFGSEIVMGPVSVTPHDDEQRPPSGMGAELVTAPNLDPFALEDGYLSEMEPPRSGSSHGSADTTRSGSRQVSARYTINDCKLRWGRGGFPDDTSPVHELVLLANSGLAFVLNPDDEAGNTLAKGDEIWMRIEIPAFLEPIFVRGALQEISGIAGNGGNARAQLTFQNVDDTLRSKLDRAADNLGATV